MTSSLPLIHRELPEQALLSLVFIMSFAFPFQGCRHTSFSRHSHAVVRPCKMKIAAFIILHKIYIMVIEICHLFYIRIVKQLKIYKDIAI